MPPLWQCCVHPNQSLSVPLLEHGRVWEILVTEITLNANVMIECEARTLSDLRALIKYCNEHRVPDDAGIDWGFGKVFVDLFDGDSVTAQWIECSDHGLGDERHDILVETHKHEDKP